MAAPHEPASHDGGRFLGPVQALARLLRYQPRARAASQLMESHAHPSPVISVVIPTHNRPTMVREAVASALAACPKLAEVVVVDDRSREPASMTLSGMAAADTRLRVIVNEGPPGAAGARNAGVVAARAKLVLFLDDDDWLLPGYASRVLAAAEGPSAPAFGFCATLSEATTDSDAPARPPRRRRARADGMLPQGTTLGRRIAGFGTGLWIRRALYLEIGGCDPAQRVDEDTEFCCRLAARGLRPWYGATPGVRLRKMSTHTDRLTRNTSAAEVVACYRRTWDRHEGSFPSWSEARWYLATRLIRRAVREGRPEDVRVTLRAAQPPTFRTALWAFFHVKRLRHSFRSARDQRVS